MKRIISICMMACMFVLSVLGSTHVQAYEWSWNTEFRGEFSSEEAFIFINKTFKNSYTITDDNGYNASGKIQSVVYTSSNTRVAIVDQTGKVTGKSAGYATITATFKLSYYDSWYEENRTDTLTMSYGINVSAPYLSSSNLWMYKKDTYKLKVYGTSGTKKWKSSNKKVVKVKNGKITARKKGKATITCKVNGFTLKCKVKVNNPQLSANVKTVTVGMKDNIYIWGHSKKGKWKVKNPSILSISKKGVIRAKKEGTTKIYCTTDGVKLRCTVTVAKNEKVFNPSYTSLEQISYGSVKFQPLRVYFSGKNMKIDAYIYNKTAKKIKKVPYIKCELYVGGSYILTKEFYKTKISVNDFSRKKVTLTLANSSYYRKHLDLRNSGVTLYHNISIE